VNLSDWTIVVQGPFLNDHEIEKCIDNILEFFPEIGIVVSTWGTNGIYSYRGATITKTKEPQSEEVIGESWGKFFQHQCLSTLNGLDHVKSSYALKIRSDCFFTNDKLRHHVTKYERSGSHFLVTTKSFRTAYPCYGVDWCVGGLSVDMVQIWSSAKKLGVSNGYYSNLHKEKLDSRPAYLSQFHPEQVMFLCQFPEWKKFTRADNTFKTFFKTLVIMESENYCIGRKNIGLCSIKYKNTVFDYYIHIMKSKIFLVTRAVTMFSITFILKIDFFNLKILK
jgi:hypothetical protein